MRRRDLASLLFAALPAPAQDAPPPEDAARKRVEAASAELSKLSVPMATEPAFQFKAF